MKVPSSTEIALLTLLGTQEFTGRELQAEHKRRYRRAITHGTIYTLLRRLRDDKWVDARKDSVDERNRIFSVSSRGRKALGLLNQLQNLLKP